jgi:two-component system torCAD operon response regulator TorR
MGHYSEAHAPEGAIHSGDPARVLVVEDEPATRDMMRELLERAGYAVVAVGTAAEARRVLAGAAPSLVVLDLNLPDQSGLVLDRELAGRQGFGVIIVTARADVIDRILGLELGADDYLTKPFAPGEFVARVKALMRRLTGQAASPAAPAVVHRFYGWTLNPVEHSLRNPQGLPVHLTRSEFDLLLILAARPGRLQRRDELLRAISGREPETVTRAIDALVARLRRKIEADPKAPQLIQTVPGLGYRFAGAGIDG